MHGLKKLIFTLFFLFPSYLFAYPPQSELFGLSESMTHIWVTFKDGVTGTGSGIVVKENHVATNCHVLADSRGVNAVKYFKTYVPIAIYADWENDLCILKFDDLPLPPVKLGNSDNLKYEDKVFALTFPNDNPVPLPSYGHVKALYPFKGGNVIRTSASFTLGSSGGALFDLDFNLIGLTTFKSPGRRFGNFYCIPAEWIEKLLQQEPQNNLVSTAMPFWSLPDIEKPFFMQIIMPMEKKQWQEMLDVAKSWTQADEDSADAWYYLGYAKAKMGSLDYAKLFLNQAYKLNDRHLEALVELYDISVSQNNPNESKRILSLIGEINSDRADFILKNS